MSDVYDDLIRQIREFRELFPPAPFDRIVINAPVINVSYIWPDGKIIWMPTKDWQALLSTVTIERVDGVNQLLGIRVEEFSWEDHGTVYRKFLEILIDPRPPSYLHLDEDRL
jgi:hypothetical protein